MEFYSSYRVGTLIERFELLSVIRVTERVL